MKCSYHPDVETALRCSKCEKPICPRCLVQTPVGARCPECANLRRPPQYEVGGGYYLRALGAGLGIAIVGGLLWAGLNVVVRGFLSLVIAIGIGYMAGEIISQVVNRKRGLGLQLIAGATVFLAFVASNFFYLLFVVANVAGGSPFDAGTVGRLLYAGFVQTVNSATSLYGLVALGLGIYLAVIRVR